jgi:uncharacterized membrane protein YfhO
MASRREPLTQSARNLVPIPHPQRAPTATVEDLDDDTVRVRLDAPTPGVLVLNDVFDVGWTATLDGTSVEVLRVNSLVRGVEVEAGEHIVVFEHRPADGVWTRALWAMGWLLALLALAVPTARSAR